MTERANLYLDEGVMAWLRTKAVAEGRSVSKQLEWLLRRAMEADKP